MLQKVSDFLNRIKNLFSTAQWEAVKEIGRLSIFVLISDILIQLINQATLIPETINLPLFIFSFTIPARLLFTALLTFALRYIDKLKHESWKTENPDIKKPGGILPF